MISDTERLDYLLSLRSPLFFKHSNGWWLIETDCGAMIIRGEGISQRDAIDQAILSTQCLVTRYAT